MCYPPMDELSKEAWLQWIDTKCAVYYKFLNDKKDMWTATRRPPWNNRSYLFRLPEDITRTDVYNYLFNKAKAFNFPGETEDKANRYSAIYAIHNLEETFQRLRHGPDTTRL